MEFSSGVLSTKTNIQIIQMVQSKINHNRCSEDNPEEPEVKYLSMKKIQYYFEFIMELIYPKFITSIQYFDYHNTMYLSYFIFACVRARRYYNKTYLLHALYYNNEIQTNPHNSSLSYICLILKYSSG